MSLLKSVFGRYRGRGGQPDAQPAPTAEQWRTRGNSALSQGNLGEAADCYRRAALADPQDALARLNLGYVLLETGDAAGAQGQFVQALALRRPDQAILHELHFLLARAFRAQGDAQAALASLKAAVDAMPTFAEAIEERVQLLHEGKAHAEALEWAYRLRSVRPGAGCEIVIAQQLHSLARNEEALAVLDAVLAEEPHPEAWTGRGNVLVGLKRMDEAVAAFDRALALVGPTPDALANSAGALSRAARLDEALQRVGEALERDPVHREALCNRLNILVELVRPQEAVEAGKSALAAYPADADIHWNLAIALLLSGRFDEGWREHEWRWEAAASRAKHPLTRHGRQWTGAEDLQGRTVLLFAEQGFGDSLQMLRYVPMVAARAARVVLHLPFGLHGLGLTRELAPNVTLVAPGEPLPPFDFHCALMSLPLAFRSGEDSIPREVPYLRVDPQRVASWERRLQAAGGRLKVGVVWYGNAAHANDANRSIALSAFRSLGLDGCFFVSLQQQMREADRDALAEWPELHRWGEELVSFDDTAALIHSLDLVISVDTSVAHLTGALGRPLWVLLPHCPDWRWMVGRSDSPWYPSARLFRQPQRHDWPSVLAAVCEALRAKVAAQVPPGDRTPLAAPQPCWPQLIERAQAEVADGRHAAALGSLEAADALAGSHPLALHLRGNALFAMQRYEEAAIAFDGALSRKPDLVEAAANAGSAWYRAGRPQESLERAELALRLRPGNKASLSNRVIALQSLGRHAEAVAAARAAHLQFPDDAELRWSYGATALLNGDYENGWPALEARWELPGAGKRPAAAELGCPLWTGREPIRGRTLLLIAEQGFGDTLQFVRYAPELVRAGARVVLWVPDAVRELLGSSLPDCLVVSRGENAPAADFHVPLMGLPLALRTSARSIPTQVPYLRAHPERVAAWRERLANSDGLHVGVVWSGNAAHANDRNRSLPLRSVLQVAVPGVSFVSLQREVRDSDWEVLRASGMADFSEALRDFSDTAALTSALDLVIAVDTSVAHLAGALGQRVWVLLPHRPDWRWLLERDDSPWYPTARLFRQPAPGAWEPVLDGVRSELEQLAAKPRASA